MDDAVLRLILKSSEVSQGAAGDDVLTRAALTYRSGGPGPPGPPTLIVCGGIPLNPTPHEMAEASTTGRLVLNGLEKVLAARGRKL